MEKSDAAAEKRSDSIWMIRWRFDGLCLIGIFKWLICTDHFVNWPLVEQKGSWQLKNVLFYVAFAHQRLIEELRKQGYYRVTSHISYIWTQCVCLCVRWHSGLLPVSSGHHTRVRGRQKWHFCRIQMRKLSNHTHIYSNTRRPACMSNKTSSIIQLLRYTITQMVQQSTFTLLLNH